MSKHADLANRIFRTVVFSGAMLGAAMPALAEQAPPPQASKPAPAKPDTWASVSKEIEATDKKLDAAILKYVAAQRKRPRTEKTAAAVTAAWTTLADLRTTRTALDARLAKTTRPAFVNEDAAPKVAKAEATLARADTNLYASIDELAAAKEDPDLKAAITAVEKDRRARGMAANKVKAERTKANRRPRTPEDERPVGRGFVLA